MRLFRKLLFEPFKIKSLNFDYFNLNLFFHLETNYLFLVKNSANLNYFVKKYYSIIFSTPFFNWKILIFHHLIYWKTSKYRISGLILTYQRIKKLFYLQIYFIGLIKIIFSLMINSHYLLFQFSTYYSYEKIFNCFFPHHFCLKIFLISLRILS